MTSQPPRPLTGPYHSYLVRFWQSHAAGCWRASAQCVQTGSTVLFGDVASLLAFLQGELHETPADDTTVYTPGRKEYGQPLDRR